MRDSLLRLRVFQRWPMGVDLPLSVSGNRQRPEEISLSIREFVAFCEMWYPRSHLKCIPHIDDPHSGFCKGLGLQLFCGLSLSKSLPLLSNLNQKCIE